MIRDARIRLRNGGVRPTRPSLHARSGVFMLPPISPCATISHLDLQPGLLDRIKSASACRTGHPPESRLRAQITPTAVISSTLVCSSGLAVRCLLRLRCCALRSFRHEQFCVCPDRTLRTAISRHHLATPAAGVSQLETRNCVCPQKFTGAVLPTIDMMSMIRRLHVYLWRMRWEDQVIL